MDYEELHEKLDKLDSRSKDAIAQLNAFSTFISHMLGVMLAGIDQNKARELKSGFLNATFDNAQFEDHPELLAMASAVFKMSKSTIAEILKKAEAVEEEIRAKNKCNS